jgi:hypothetical protein
MDTRNYKEDQANEVEALESIYYGDMESKFWDRLTPNVDE